MHQYTDRDELLSSEEFAQLDEGYQKAYRKMVTGRVDEKVRMLYADFFSI
jgi:hypothetical protein